MYRNIHEILYMTELTMNVENKIVQSLPTKFALVFDGWLLHSTHYVDVFASFTEDNEKGYGTRLLAVSSLIDEEDLSADEHK